MSDQEYEDLWHYSEQFSRDKLQRSELVTMVWKEGQRLGSRCTNGLMKSMMHFRSKELDRDLHFRQKMSEKEHSTLGITSAFTLTGRGRMMPNQYHSQSFCYQ